MDATGLYAAFAMALHALVGTGCRRVAMVFNRLHRNASIGKSFVAEVFEAHQMEIAQLRRNMRNTKPKDMAVNQVWALDLTFFTDCDKQAHAALGIVEHGSRLNVCLQRLTVRNAWMVLGWLCMAIAKFGKPQRVRTDNEAIFTGFVFRTFLKLVGIQRERIQKHSPWQNGRVERFFGGLKPLLKSLVITNGVALQMALDEFRLFYNHVLPHQNLGGLTPMEHFCGLRPADIREKPATEVVYVQGLCGLLQGYWIRRWLGWIGFNGVQRSGVRALEGVGWVLCIFCQKNGQFEVGEVVRIGVKSGCGLSFEGLFCKKWGLKGVGEVCGQCGRDNGTTGQRDNGTTGQRDNGTTGQRDNTKKHTILSSKL